MQLLARETGREVLPVSIKDAAALKKFSDRLTKAICYKLKALVMEYRPTIGLEIHAELKTRTKMFCDCANDPDEMRPNVNICPICTAHPGTLPVINHEAVRHILRIGAAVGGRFADSSEFDRKSYFYPDIPKGIKSANTRIRLLSAARWLALH